MNDMTKTLQVRLNDELVGHLRMDTHGEMSFEYDDAYLGVASTPLSQSLPLRKEPFNQLECAPFFAGLLPDNPQARQALGKQFHVSDDNSFGLLANIGRDCAGAVVIAPEPQALEPRQGWLEELDEAQLADLIDNLPHRPLAAVEGEVMLSLAGVHDKAAVFVDPAGQVSLPHHGHPSSHILKVDIKGLPDSIRTESFLLKLAREMKLPVPHSRVGEAEGKTYMLVSRFDRVVSWNEDGSAGRIRRLHQEDFCQALGVPPHMKYEHEGGPTLADMFKLVFKVTRVPVKEVLKLTDYVIYNFLIGNPDSHAKNYSLVYRPRAVELSPIYDLNNAKAFEHHFKKVRPRIAQAIGGERNPEMIGREHWLKFADECGLRGASVLKRLVAQAEMMPAAVRALREKLRGTVADCEALDLVVNDIADRCARVLSWEAAPVLPAPDAPEAPSLKI
ncbi:type II toxin-antitoxin system HipA family toxin [Thalassospira xianhensis]|uniref:type II toxin-antitoxin system HipA family toxin n=1 Tax=Thalassospira xianhensis TaxID=478503 RepID=UPI00142E12CE|nr:type II toxin-antitoxin system HipA family toxin [Thalassospira xianhensis]